LFSPLQDELFFIIFTKSQEKQTSHKGSEVNKYQTILVYFTALKSCDKFSFIYEGKKQNSCWLELLKM